jgi:class 3 adenylate cyclase/tetratricopeptide (TPR) repeat protein
MKCPRCGAASPQGKKFCGDCGATLTVGLSRPDHAGDRWRTSTLADLLPNEAERRPLTVAFCDLVDSTRLSTELDAEDLRDVIALYHRAVADTIDRYDGFVAKYMGDGILLYFGYPRAHEDDAARAVAAALDLVEATRTLRSSVIDEPLHIRVGIATGEAVVGDLLGTGAAQERAAVGVVPNLAARLQALAGPDTVVISATTKRLTGGLFDYRDLGTVAIKGFPEPIRAWKVVGSSGVESRFDALHADQQVPLVGRDRDINLLLRYWAEAKAGRGRVVLLSGEPGIGKSRIAADLLAKLHGEAFTSLRFFCSADHDDSTLHPLLARIERAADFKRDDTSDRKLEKLEALLSWSRDRSTDVVLLADLLSIPTKGRYPPLTLNAELRKEKTLATLVAQFEAMAAHRPTMLICEDAQWIDATSLELLNRLIARIGASSAMILVTFRPEFKPPWLGQPHVISQQLGRLHRDDAVQIVKHLARNKPLPEKMTEHILERTDGVPLFVEELTRTVLESAFLREESRGYVWDGPAASAVPATLRASLVARLDRLTPVKEVAQIASVLGREFSFEMLASVSSRPEHELQGALDQLEGAGLVFARDPPLRSNYVFKHALVQDAAYGTMLRNRRRQLHGRAGSALEAQFPEIAAFQPELVARHYTEAGLPTKAIGYWLKAGHLAGARSANVEARSHLTKGLELVQRMAPGRERDRQELRFQSLLGPALIATRGHAAPEPLAAYRRALALMRTTGDTAHQDSISFGLFNIYYNRAEFGKALKLCRELLQIAEQRNEAIFRSIACGMLSGLYNLFGRFPAGRDYADRAVSFCESMRPGPSDWRYHIELRTSAPFQLGIALWHLGFADQSMALEQNGLTSAERLNHQVTMGFVLTFAALSAFRRHDYDELGRAAARMQAYARQHSMTQLLAWGTCLEGPALAAASPAQAIEQIEAGIALCEKIGNKAFRPIWLTGLAEAQLAAGRAKQAMHSIERALATADRTRERWMNAELWRLKGSIVSRLRRRRVDEETEACLRFALALANRQRSRMLSLRAATALAELYERQGLRNRAREVLLPRYMSFTEGLDTPDLKQAKSLLDALQ